MACTKIVAIRHTLNKSLDYISDPNKTALNNAIDYVMNNDKTEKGLFISAFNCSSVTAYEQMVSTQKSWAKQGKAKILGYHVMQSFMPGEVTPDQAHEVGCEFVRRCLAKKYEVVVTTHLNRKHLHNHIIFNSVSFADGIMYRNSFADYYRDIRAISDGLCKEYGLSLIEEPAYKGKHYAQWKAEQEGRLTWQGLIKADVDKAIEESMTFSAFLANLRKQGYEIKTGVKHMAVRPPGKPKFARLRSIGEMYTEEAIKQRILRQQIPKRPPKPLEPTGRLTRFKGNFKLHRITIKSIRALYFYYLHKLRQAQHQPQGQTHFLLREELLNLDTISNLAKFLNKYRLDTSEQVTEHKAQTEKKLSAFIFERKDLKNENRHTGIPDSRKAEIQTRLGVLTQEIASLKQEVKLCDAVLDRSFILKEKRECIKQQYSKEKEMIHYEPDRRRSRTDRQYGG